jgi:hypothetical protein
MFLTNIDLMNIPFKKNRKGIHSAKPTWGFGFSSPRMKQITIYLNQTTFIRKHAISFKWMTLIFFSILLLQHLKDNMDLRVFGYWDRAAYFLGIMSLRLASNSRWPSCLSLPWCWDCRPVTYLKWVATDLMKNKQTSALGPLWVLR